MSESIEFRFVGTGADQLAGDFKKTGDNAALAAKGARLCADALNSQRKAAGTSAGATLALAKADQILSDAEDELSGRAALADAALRGQGDAAKKAGKDAADAGGGFAGLAGSGGIPGGGIGAAIAAGVALAPVIVTAGVGLAGFGAAAYSTARPILAAAQAAGGLKANMAGLDPEQRQVAKGLLTLQGDYGSFVKSLQPEVFSAFNSGLGIAKTLLGGAAPVAQAAGKALDGVLADLGADLKTSQWQQFFTFMATTAGPDVTMLGTAFTSLLNVLPGVLEDLQPVAVQMLGLVTNFADATGAVVNFGKSNSQLSASVGTNTGVLGFLSKAVSNVSSFMKPGGVLAGAYSDAISGIPGSTGQAATAVQKLARQQALAVPSATNLAADIQILGSDTATAANQATALSDAWGILVGNFATSETAVLNARQAVATFAGDVKQAGAGSLTAQLGFESAVTSIGQMVTALQNAHAPAKTLYNDLQNQITALAKSGPLNAEEAKQLAGMTLAADAVAFSTGGWTKATKDSATAIQAKLLPQLASLHVNTPLVRTDVSNLTDSIINTGTKSAATHDARSRLIQDLVNAGLGAKQATTLVSGLQTKIDALHGKSVGVTVFAAGGGGMTFTEKVASSISSGGFSLHSLAAGGMITQGTGPAADDVLIRASKGELIVPAHLVPAVKPVLGGKIPGFAAGGIAGMIPFAANAEAGFARAVAANLLSRELAHLKATVAAAAHAKAAAAASSPLGFALLPGGGAAPGSSAAAAQAWARAQLAGGAYGWGTGQFPPLRSLWNQESGWRWNADNPSSGAYGIPQSLPADKMASAGADWRTNAATQMRWGMAYIRSVYGSPSGAWAHEVANNWYDRGGLLMPGVTIAHNTTGRPEQVIPAGGAGAGKIEVTLSFDPSVQAVLSESQIKAIRYTVRTKGGGSVQKAFGK
jgi:hypothetical protein